MRAGGRAGVQEQPASLQHVIQVYAAEGGQSEDHLRRAKFYVQAREQSTSSHTLLMQREFLSECSDWAPGLGWVKIFVPDAELK